MDTVYRIRTLLVEDNPGDARLLIEALRSSDTASFEVVTASTLADARAHLREAPVDLMVLDLSLPDSQGLSTFSEAQAAAPGVPIVVLTGLDDDQLSTKLMAAGAQDYVVKGVFNPALVTRIALHAVERQRLLTADKQRIVELQALFRIATILSGPGTLKKNTKEVLDVLIEAVGAGRAVLRLPTRALDRLVVYAATGPLARDYPPPQFISSSGDGVSARAFNQGSVIINDDHYPRRPDAPWNPSVAPLAAIGLPIVAGSEIKGVLQVASERRGFFDASKVALLSAMARSLGVLINNAQLRETLEVERALRERKDDFISIASHELRTPMTTMLGLTELLMDQEPEVPERHTWYARINSETKRLTVIVDELLDVSRIQSGSLRVSLAPVSFGEMAELVVDEFQYQAHGHELVVDCTDRIPQVLADRDKLSQVLRNLVDNAIKYSPDGGEVRVSFEHRPAEEMVIASITDCGIGITAADRKRLFGTFARGSQPEIATIRGTGLGLYIVKSLVELMNGRIWLKSRPWKGTTFNVGLPVAPLG